MIDLNSTLKIYLRSLKVNKMRSILTSLGIIIGVSAVIIMLSIGEGVKTKITKDISSGGSNILMVMSGSSTSGGVRMGSGSQPTLTIKDANAILKNCPSVLAVAPVVNSSKQIVYSKSREGDGLVIKSKPDFAVAITITCQIFPTDLPFFILKTMKIERIYSRFHL